MDMIMKQLLDRLNELRTCKRQIFTDAQKLTDELNDVNTMERAIMEALCDLYGTGWTQYDTEGLKQRRQTMSFPKVLLYCRVKD